jgi:putative transposase
MRGARMRVDSEGTYYHLIARASGCASDRPFGEAEKDKLVELIRSLSRLYTVEVLGYCVMSTHLHLVVYAPAELPTEAQAAARFRAYYGAQKALPLPGSAAFGTLQARLRDISCLMKDLLMRFTCWYNRTRPRRRRGRLWADRYSSVILQGKGASAVWGCLVYIALNSVRAGIVEDPGSYRFSSWGVYRGSGRHPFEAELVRHARRVLGEALAGAGADDILAALGRDLARVVAGEAGGDQAGIAAARAGGRRRPPVPWLRADRRVRVWSAGAVLGSRRFVRDCYARFVDADRSRRHRPARGCLADGNCLYALRRLQIDTE